MSLARRELGENAQCSVLSVGRLQVESRLGAEEVWCDFGPSLGQLAPPVGRFCGDEIFFHTSERGEFVGEPEEPLQWRNLSAMCASQLPGGSHFCGP